MKNLYLLLFICIIFLVSCNNGNYARTDSKYVDGICPIHNTDCSKSAKEMDFTIEEFHDWKVTQEKAIELEDDMTDENGNIVDPDAEFIHIAPEESIPSESNDYESNSNSQEICKFCRPYNSKGWEIEDYEPAASVTGMSGRTNKRYVEMPGYKPCSSCQGTGDCRVASRCGYGDSNLCRQCNGERFEECDRCNGTGYQR